MPLMAHYVQTVVVWVMVGYLIGLTIYLIKKGG